MHDQIAVKVNSICDVGIAPLVAALSDIPGVITLDSCEDGAWGAYVFFKYGENWQELASLLQKITTGLAQAPLPCGYSFRLEWLGSNDQPRAQLTLEPPHVEIVAAAIQRIIPILNARMTELTGGK